MDNERSRKLRELAENITRNSNSNDSNNSGKSVASSTGSNHGTVSSDDTLFTYEENESDFDFSYVQASTGIIDEFFAVRGRQRSNGNPSSSKPVRKWRIPNEASAVTKHSSRSSSASSSSSRGSQQLPRLPKAEENRPPMPTVSSHGSFADDTTSSSIGLNSIFERLAHIRTRARAASCTDVDVQPSVTKAPISPRRVTVGSAQLFQRSQKISIMRDTLTFATNSQPTSSPSSPFVEDPRERLEKDFNDTLTSHKSYLSAVPAESDNDNTQESFGSNGTIIRDEEASCRVISNPFGLSTITEQSREESRKSSAQLAPEGKFLSFSLCWIL